MLFLKSWLQDYINLDGLSSAELANIITKKSSEVESIVEVTERFECKVVVGKIQSLRKHPEADKLNIFEVNLGEKGIVQIVSAAPNVKDGLIIPVALDGAKLAGFTIQAKKLRGYESQGMCCGKSELLLETEYSLGLWELNSLLEDEAFLGWSICEALPEYFCTEEVMDIKVLPDKIGVIGNHLGMALEIALILEKPELLTKLALSLTKQDQVINQIQDISNKYFSLKNDNSNDNLNNNEKAGSSIIFKDNCNYAKSFNLFKFEISKPFKLDCILQQRMNLLQKNLAGGLVDLSNYLLLDIGQPNHFFSVPKLEKITANNDHKKLNNSLENKVIWTIEKLDSNQDFKGLGQLKQANLPSNLVVLKQEEETLHIPGISGGESTKVEEDDTSFIVEIANFKPDQIGRNCFALNYRSDGSKIWSGGVNPARILTGLIRLTNFLETKVTNSNIPLMWLANIGSLPELNVLAEKIIEFENNTINVDLNYIISRLDGRSIDYWKEIVVSKLKCLGDYNLENSNLNLNIFYNRVRTQEDVLAEIVRLIEFENLQENYLEFTTSPTKKSDFQKKQNWKKTLVNFGFYETITRPFLAENELLINLNKENNTGDNLAEMTFHNYTPFKILNPYSSLQPFFRDSLLPSLLQSVSANIKHGHKEINIFEAGQVYYLKNESKQEVYEICGLCVGEEISRITSLIHFLSNSLNSNITYNEIDTNNLLSKIGQGVEYSLFSNSSNSSADLKNVLLHNISVFEINKKTKKFFDIPLNKLVWGFKIDFKNLISDLNTYPKYAEESEYPSITRSYSLLIPSNLLWSEVVDIIKQKAPKEIELSIIPKERIAETETSLVALNFQVNLKCFTRTLEGTEVDYWEKNWQEVLFQKYSQAKLR